jgi:hypothetical protein
MQAYSWDKIARRLLDVYAEAIAEFKRRSLPELALPAPVARPA